jgi:hypothetical protein
VEKDTATTRANAEQVAQQIAEFKQDALSVSMQPAAVY